MALTLVTGVSGFTGARLAIELARQGYAVRGLSGTGRNLERLRQAGVETIVGDLRDRDTVFRAIEGVGIVYHATSVGGDARATHQRHSNDSLGGTRHVFEAAQAHGVERVLHVSMAAARGIGDELRESMLAAERFAVAFAFRSGLQTTIVRPSGVYGPGDTRFLKLFRDVARGRFVMVRDGDAPTHLTYIDDLCRALVLAANSPDAVGRTYLIGGPSAVSHETLALKVAQELAVRRPRLRVPQKLLRARASLARSFRIPGTRSLERNRADGARAYHAFTTGCAWSELGFAPRVDVGEGVRRTAAWYREYAAL